MKKVLVVAAHPDDEVLGCAGTIVQHIRRGDKVSFLFMTNGEGARAHEDQQVESRLDAAKNAALALGVTDVTMLLFPDNQMDTVSLLEIVKEIEDKVRQFKPSIIYTHFGGDLNIDHQITYQAVLTANRPQPEHHVSSIYCFEVPSSTEWAPLHGCGFRPNLFVDIKGTEEEVTRAIDCYSKELRCWPHSRSIEAISSLKKWRGASVGLEKADAFMIEREIIKF